LQIDHPGTLQADTDVSRPQACKDGVNVFLTIRTVIECYIKIADNISLIILNII